MDRRSADVVVVGAGPAGLAAAIHAASGGARVLVVEKNALAGVKLLSTGGGRCNLTNTATHEEFAARFGPRGRFVTDALRHLDATALRLMLASLDVPTRSLDGRHVYPTSESARDVRDALLRRCRSLGVEFEFTSRVAALTFSDGLVAGLATDRMEVAAARVVVAAGGRSYPAFGSTGDGYALARSAGHGVVEPVPALVPLLSADEVVASCAGVAVAGVRVRLTLGGKDLEARGDILFTHRGVSGPAVLDLSGMASRALADESEVALLVDFTPHAAASEWQGRLDEWRGAEGATMVRTLVARHLPARLAAALVAKACANGDVRASQLKGDERSALVESVKKLRLAVTGTEGWERAMVTRGGVQLKEMDPKTLESRICKGLFFAGEVLDLDGPCGGYNLQWAFSSGALAGASCVLGGEGS